jgi:ABC-type bacteriocin/lantibiotic exporter with double-glycine peptidase domain
MKQLKYIKQHNDYSCGPACIRMILGCYNIKHSKKQICELCESKPFIGTKHRQMEICANEMGLRSETKVGAQIKDIIETLNQGAFPVVNYLNPLSLKGHFAIVTNVDTHEIKFADPKNGNGYTLKTNEFLELWHNTDNSVKNWMISLWLI